MTEAPRNRVALDAIRTMPIGTLAALPADQLALLQDDADAALKAATALKDWLDGAIALRFAPEAARVRQAAAKVSGSVRFKDGEVTIVADLPKKVDWDQRQLGALVERIRSSGENPGDYVETSFHVSERSYGAWPEAIRRTFEPARTVRTGKPSFRLITT